MNIGSPMRRAAPVRLPTGRRNRPRFVRRLVVALVLAGGALLVAGAALAASAAGDLQGARRELVAAERHTRDLAFEPARTSLEHAATLLARARSRLDLVPIRVAARIPYVGRSVRAIDRIVDAAGEVVAGARAGLSLSDALPGADRFRLEGGRLPPVDWDAVERSSRTAAAAFGRAEDLARAAPTALVPGPIVRVRAELLAEAAGARTTARHLALGAHVLPRMLGERGPRRHVIVVQNLAEARATGGAIESVMLLRADARGIDLLRADGDEEVLGTPTDPAAGHALNLEPHFPRAARRIAGRYRARTGIDVDGVTALDAHAIARFLAVTGGVTVDGRRLDAETAPRFLSRDIFRHYPGEAAQSAFLGAVTARTWERLRDGSFAVSDLLEQLGSAARAKHILVWSAHPGEQRALEELAVAGVFSEPAAGASRLAVVANQPTTAEMDAFAEREIRYRVELAPDGTALASLTVTLHHRGGTAPPEVRRKAGDGRLHSDISAWGAGPVARTFRLSVPPGRSRARTVTGASSTTPGRYRLHVHRQPTIRPDRLAIEIVLPPGATPTGMAPGMEAVGYVVRWTGDLRTDLDLLVAYG